jgi:FMN phosphatase YigB (HAD superfamily)
MANAAIGTWCTVSTCLSSCSDELAAGEKRMSERFPVVFLVDVDNTLLDNDHLQNDLQEHLEREFGATCRDRYSKILENLFEEFGYRDYLGALQRYRNEHPTDIRLLAMSSYLVDYPFADRLYPGALEVLNRLRSWGQTVILSDGDVVFQPRKVERSGIGQAVSGHVLIYIHKEEALPDVERRYPAAHYVVIDDKLRILSAIKKVWGDRVTTVFPRQGKFAYDPKILAAFPAPDVTIERIGDLLSYEPSNLVPPIRDQRETAQK